MVTQGVSFAHFLYYPDSDGKPMAESEIHGDVIEDIKYKLTHYFRDKPLVHVGGNLFLYYIEGDPTKNTSPDVYVTFGLDKEPRNTYKLWVERRPPDIIFEITSKSTKFEDIGPKKGIYEALGVREYFLIDPLGDYLDPPLQGYRLGKHKHYLPLIADPDSKEIELESGVLGLRLSWSAGKVTMRVIETGEVLLSASEQAQRAEQEAQRAEQEAQRAEQEARRAEQEARRAEQEARRAEQEARRAAQAEENLLRERQAREDLEKQLAEMKVRLEAFESKG